ncbi:MAG: hypothetical protein ABI623_10875 [bacterium]
MNSQRDFLLIGDGETVSIKLKYNTGLLRNGQFGKYFIYTIVHDGKEKLLKVTERLEKQFRKQDVQNEQEIQLRKDAVTPKQGEPYSVINLVVDNKENPPASPSLRTDQQTKLLDNVIEPTEELQLLSAALNDARSICKANGDPSIIPEVTLAVGLFLARTMRTAMNVSNNSSNHRPRRFTRRTPKPTSAQNKACPPCSTSGRDPVARPTRPEDDLPF